MVVDGRGRGTVGPGPRDGLSPENVPPRGGVLGYQWLPDLHRGQSGWESFFVLILKEKDMTRFLWLVSTKSVACETVPD